MPCFSRKAKASTKEFLLCQEGQEVYPLLTFTGEKKSNVNEPSGQLIPAIASLELICNMQK